MILHSFFIFFSCLLAWLLFPTLSIVFFVVGVFFMFVAGGLVYCLRVRCVLVFSFMSMLLVVFVVFCAGCCVPLVSLAVGLLEFFYVFQVVFWSILLLPFVAQQYYVSGRPYAGVLSAFFFSVLAALFSLFFVAMPVYGSIYLVFCFVLLWVLEKNYGAGAGS